MPEIAEIKVINGQEYHELRPEIIGLPDGYLFFALLYEPEYKGIIYYKDSFVSLTKANATRAEIREIACLHQKSLKK